VSFPLTTSFSSPEKRNMASPHRLQKIKRSFYHNLRGDEFGKAVKVLPPYVILDFCECHRARIADKKGAQPTATTGKALR
jgi:hypothetical protein